MLVKLKLHIVFCGFFTGHLRLLYADHGVAVLYFCKKLWIRGVCAPNEGELLLLSRTPSLNDEKAASVRENLKSHDHKSIDDIARKAGFESNIGGNISFDGNEFRHPSLFLCRHGFL